MSKDIQLAVFALSKNAKDFYIEFLTDIFKETVKMTSYSIEEKITDPITVKVVLPTHEILVDKARELFPQSTIINTKKALIGTNLEKLIMLPKGKQVLVVANPELISLETINNLIDLGINHLDYVCYNCNNTSDLTDIDTAISPGMIHLCPHQIKNKIDIGGRIISIKTFLNLLQELDLNIDYIDSFINLYLQKLMQISQKLVHINKQSELLRKEQETILNVIEEGIISVENKKIRSINPAAIKLLDIKAADFHNSEIGDVLGKFGKVGIPIDENDENPNNILLSYNDKNLICSKTPMHNSESAKEEFIYTIKEVSKIQILEQKVRQQLAKKGHVTKYTLDDIQGSSKKINEAKTKAKELAKNDLSILILGESGTGKELLTQAIHNESLRKNGPFLAINFAAIPESLVESELFGYEDGAFTGAKKGGKQGIFELAHGGTLFLDEIGDAPASIQARLLRVLQEHEIMRVGGSTIIPINIRVVAATNKDLKEKVANNQFRNDLYYRLNVLPIEIPPLRERKEDILIILDKFFKEKYQKKKIIKQEVIDILLKYDWPGNVRELLNVANYLHQITNERTEILIYDLPTYLLKETEINANKTNNPADMDYIKNKLVELGNLDEIYLLLEFLYSNNGYCIGRSKIRKEMLKNNFYVSDDRIKKYLKSLQSLNIISVGTTRQGSRITAIGVELLNSKN